MRMKPITNGRTLWDSTSYFMQLHRREDAPDSWIVSEKVSVSETHKTFRHIYTTYDEAEAFSIGIMIIAFDKPPRYVLEQEQRPPFDTVTLSEVQKIFIIASLREHCYVNIEDIGMLFLHPDSPRVAFSPSDTLQEKVMSTEDLPE